LPRSKMKLLLPDTVENLMKRELRAAGRREIGGVLLGESVGPGIFRVAEITVQRTESACRALGFDLGWF
jgi:[CysO sulfur-carrier protein]-S-L-cysteine hydrolase